MWFSCCVSVSPRTCLLRADRFDLGHLLDAQPGPQNPGCRPTQARLDPVLLPGVHDPAPVLRHLLLPELGHQPAAVQRVLAPVPRRLLAGAALSPEPAARQPGAPAAGPGRLLGLRLPQRQRPLAPPTAPPGLAPQLLGQDHAPAFPKHVSEPGRGQARGRDPAIESRAAGGRVGDETSQLCSGERSSGARGVTATVAAWSAHQPCLPGTAAFPAHGAGGGARGLGGQMPALGLLRLLLPPELWLQAGLCHPLPSKYTRKVHPDRIYSELTKMFSTELFHYLQRN